MPQPASWARTTPWAIVAACASCNLPDAWQGALPELPLPIPHEAPAIGFFTHRSVPPAVVDTAQFGIMGAYTVAEVETSLQLADAAGFSVDFDLSPQVTRALPAERVRTTYVTERGDSRQKAFYPKGDYNLREFVDEATLRERLAPYLDRFQRYPKAVRVLYVTEEPYINGISRDALTIATRVVRGLLQERGLDHVQLGVIFATAMFDAEFAAEVERGSIAYAQQIDEHYAKHVHLLDAPADTPEAADFQKWSHDVQNFRLATYDRAGNTFTGGGVPDGIDVVGFDFYTSTLLQDQLYDRSLAWFAERQLAEACEPFRNTRIVDLRKQLSFFQDGETRPSVAQRAADRKLLDTMFQCRMDAATRLLRSAVGTRDIDLLMIAESSTNGALDFTASGRPEPTQFPDLLDERVRDDVMRAEHYYALHQSEFDAGLAFFLYDDAFDEALRLNLGGVANNPTALAEIRRFAHAPPSP